MDIGALTSNYKFKRKHIVVYLIFLVILIPVLNQKQEFEVDSAPDKTEEKYFEIEQFTEKANYSIINNEFNIFYKDIIIKDDLAIINNKFTIRIYNITEPEEPKILSESTRCVSDILKMQVEGDTLFIGYNFYPSGSTMTKIQAYNISDPTIIEPIGCFLYYNFHDFVIKDDYGYISTNRDKIVIVSVQDPTNMTIVGELGGFTSAYYKILVHDNCSILYANEYDDQDEYVLFVDISDKENPVIAHHGTIYYQILKALIYNDALFLLSFNSLISVNISNIYSPQYLASYGIFDVSSFYINEGYAYVEDYNRLLIVDVRDASDFDFITYHFLNDINASYVSSMDFYGNYTFFSCGLGGISVYNTTGFIDFTKLYQSGFNQGKEVYYENGLCYVLERNRFNVFNASTLSHLTLLNSFELDYADDMQIESNRAYILTLTQIDILNISNPTNITKIGEVNVYNPNIMKVKNGLVAVMGNDLNLFNTTDPEAVTLLDQVDVPSGYYIAIEMTNETIILSNYRGEIHLIDYSNPNNLLLIKTVEIEEYYNAESTFFYENYLFLTSDYEQEILVVNLTTMQFASYFYLSGFYGGFMDIYIEDDLMYLTSWHSALMVYNISDLHNIALQSEIDLFSQPALEIGTRLHVQNNTIFLLNEAGALQIIGLDSDNDYLANYLEEIYFTTTGLRDSDNDLILDGYEVHYGLDPLNISDASDDFDNDNLTNLEEFLYFSNPTLKDSDFDCLNDNDEITIYNTNLTSSDTDEDLLVDGYEIYVSMTNPLLGDTDQDGLLDGYEVVYYFTNPLDNDTDKDSMDDFYEVEYNLNPLDSSDQYLDLDMDGLLNYEEYTYNTRPDSADTDHDFYSDLEEIEYGSDPLDPNDHPDYTKTFTTSFAGYKELSVLGTAILVLCLTTIIIRFRKKRGVRDD